ncbi:MAG: hypothetical protein JXR19_05895 [Bacteroidia bacterium]
MACFITMIVAMGIRMATSSSELYERDYYEKGEEHAERMLQESQSGNINLSYDYSFKGLAVDFGDVEGIINQVRCLKLSDSSKDFIYKPDQKRFRTGSLRLDLSSGIWVLEVTGTRNGQEFFKKLQVTI